MVRLLPLLLLLPTVALGQTQAVVLDINGMNGVLVGRDACADVITVNWTITAQACADFNLWLAETTCGDVPAAGEHVVKTLSPSQVLASPTGSATFAVSSLPAFKTEACPRTGVEVENKVCGAMKTFGGAFQNECNTVQKDNTVGVTYDAKPPATPTLGEVTGLDGALSANFDLADDVFGFRLEVSEAGLDAWQSTSVLVPGTVARFDGLTNDTTYDVRVIVQDEAGNESAPSNVLQGTPVDSRGFWEAYEDAGGKGNGGCSAAGGLWLLPALLSGWLINSRRRR